MIKQSGADYSIVIDESKCRIESLKKGGKEFVCQQTKLPLFSIALLDSDKNQVYAEAPGRCCSAVYQPSQQGYDLYCNGLGGAEIDAVVHVSFTDEEILWRIEIENRSGYIIEWVDFPQFVVPFEAGADKILWGFNEGVVVEDPAFREKMRFPYIEPAYPSQGSMGIFPAIVETQFMAYYGDNGGLYFAAHDPDDNVKGIDFHTAGTGIKLQFRLFTGTERGESFALPYDMVMHMFEGDWYDAAELYRNWFETHRPDSFTEIEKNPHIPEWYEQSPIVVTYPVRGVHDTDTMQPNKLFPYSNAGPHIERLAEELDSRILTLLMHWEGTAPWAPPYVWPPYGGEKALEQFLQMLHAGGHLLGVYCSGLGWTQQSNLVPAYNKSGQFEKEHLAEIMCAPPNGDLPYSKICTDQRIGYDMCPSQQFTADVISDQVQKMVDAGIDYIQVLDQNHGGAAYFCYSEKHGHPPVPGKWQTEAMVNLLKRLQEIVKNGENQVLLGCESAAAEPYIPYLLFNDNRYNLNYEIGTPVPVYAYIYHRYINNFMGNQVCANYTFDHEQSPDNILYRYAYAFHAGDMLTLVLNEDGKITWNWGKLQISSLPNQEQILAFVKDCNAWRKGVGKPYLHFGRMCKPYKVTCGKKNTFHLVSNQTHTGEQLLTSCWIDNNGKKAQFIVNYNARDIDCSIRIKDGITITLYTHPTSVVGETISVSEARHLRIKSLSSVMLEISE